MSITDDYGWCVAIVNDFVLCMLRDERAEMNNKFFFCFFYDFSFFVCYNFLLCFIFCLKKFKKKKY